MPTSNQQTEADLIALALSRGGTLGKSAAETLAITQTCEPVPSERQDRGPPVMVDASVQVVVTKCPACGGHCNDSPPPVGINCPTCQDAGKFRKLVALIPCVTRSEANEPAWVKKMRRKLSAKAATRNVLGCYLAELAPFAMAYQCQHALRVRFTRHGGRHLDQGNLSVSMKAVEDVVAGVLCASDGDPRWQVTYHEVPGGAVGVRVEIEVPYA